MDLMAGLLATWEAGGITIVLFLFVILVFVGVPAMIAGLVTSIIKAVRGPQEPRTDVAPGKGPDDELQSESVDNREFREWERQKEIGLVVFGGVLLIIVLVVGYALHRLEESGFCVGGPCF